MNNNFQADIQHQTTKSLHTQGGLPRSHQVSRLTEIAGEETGTWYTVKSATRPSGQAAKFLGQPGLTCVTHTATVDKLRFIGTFSSTVK